MKAALLEEPGRLTVRDVPTPPCPPEGVLVEIKACGICSADAKMVTSGHRALTYPRILGHEIAGVVVESRTRRFKADDRVQVAPGLRCGECSYCARGQDNQCDRREILGFSRDGGFAQYIAVPLTGSIVGALTLLPEPVSCTDAAWGEPLACCINAQEKTGTRPGDTVLIIGAGPLGVLHSFVAKSRGAGTVILSENSKHRRILSAHSWADHITDGSYATLVETIEDVTEGRGVDVLIFACSQVGLNDEWIRLLAPCGRVSVFSGTPPSIAQIHLDSNTLHYKEIVVSGSYGCTAQQNRTAVEMMASPLWSSHALETRSVDLSTIEQGIEDTKNHRALKSILEVANGN